uniref:Uncharacterized protein n=1 Tax=Rhizophora mucronata TaxID=61149 RepID=A0A2P2PY78_RHIMU
MLPALFYHFHCGSLFALTHTCFSNSTTTPTTNP